MEDFRVVTDYLVTLDYVDDQRIGVLGICGGGGYAINASMTERRIKAVATITGANYGRVMREGVLANGDPVAFTEDIARQRTAEARGAALRVDVGLYPSVEAAQQDGADIDLREATEYYRTARGEAGTAQTRRCIPITRWPWVGTRSTAEVLLTQPLLVIVGSKPGLFGALRDGYEIVRRAKSQHKELVVVEGWSHYDLYDKPEPVARALEKLVPFFNATL